MGVSCRGKHVIYYEKYLTYLYLRVYARKNLHIR